MLQISGALIAGEQDLSLAFFYRADQQLEAIRQRQPDCLNDYAMALGLIAMAAQAVRLDTKTDKVADYLSGSAAICNRNRRQNSDAFVRYLLFSAHQPKTYREYCQVDKFLADQNNEDIFCISSIQPESITVVKLEGKVESVRGTHPVQMSMTLSRKNMKNILIGEFAQD